MPIPSDFTNFPKSNGGHPHEQPPYLFRHYDLYKVLFVLFRVIHDKLTIAGEAFGTDVLLG